ncbi:metalloregulator ArsR/SmtB family transcription factor [Simiduia sp. 21SJ11W-1]|uniref:metalloregulator ArsR/SmtB family transcription factor n=1 Tax=Simiduia sp. 21SJ11W-1 TaxID=2909669 RepID=UPI00209FF0BD|nr:metalloregulator ArsR/SmtB family transcription factor [Simiduia sp. 21SJ11W-1]UTA47101.1 metalloregulator ArsR/SmtB family transcription factor [Simiduia sp. 21SJ11W-1]
MQPTAFFKLLADETRLKSLLLITREGELCVCELTCALGESQPKISRHLAQLRAGGLLEDRRQGQWVYYRLSPTLPEWCQSLLADTLAANPRFLTPAVAQLAKMGDRPARARACC